DLDKITDILVRETGLLDINIKNHRHLTIVISRHFLRHQFEDPGEEDGDDIDHQANHGTRIANQVYGKPLELGLIVNEWSISHYFPVSEEFWKWMYAEPSPDDDDSSGLFADEVKGGSWE
ncbi:hypothetical protein K440DRAFT_615816, partial [Wilcoxina mikolae CBS 423.85]